MHLIFTEDKERAAVNYEGKWGRGGVGEGGSGGGGLVGEGGSGGGGKGGWSSTGVYQVKGILIAAPERPR